MSQEDALKIKNEGADAIQVSNHGGRQLESATSAINALPLIREALGKEFPLIFFSISLIFHIFKKFLSNDVRSNFINIS